jgi:glyoxylase-like metal-dependent hydrolase (beta-lactamase superfamily II)
LKIHRFKLSVSNAYLIQSERPILVDTGSPSDFERLRAKLREQQVEFSDLALIVHTHIHSDHMGCTARIAAESDCPIAYHPADQSNANRSHNGTLTGIGLRGRIMKRFFSNLKFDSIPADVDLFDGMTLNDYGANVTVIATPGHTSGSISLITPDGDGIIGDTIMGGYLGGALLPQWPNYHYFADDLVQAMKSLDSVLAQTHRILYVGHGGPLTHSDVQRWRSRHRERFISR